MFFFHLAVKVLFNMVAQLLVSIKKLQKNFCFINHKFRNKTYYYILNYVLFYSKLVGEIIYPGSKYIIVKYQHKQCRRKLQLLGKVVFGIKLVTAVVSQIPRIRIDSGMQQIAISEWLTVRPVLGSSLRGQQYSIQRYYHHQLCYNVSTSINVAT